MPSLHSADRYYRLSAGIARKAVLDARDAHHRGVGPVAEILQAHQRAEVDLARIAVGTMLDEQSITAAATALLDSPAFTTMVDDLERMLDQVTTGPAFDRLIGSLTQGAARDAMSLEVAARPDLAWVRHVNPPCCSRCAILAGRVYRWSDGFERHPGCDCVNIPTTVSAGAGLTMNPDELVAQGLVTGLSKADLQLLAEGGDLNQIVNIRKQAAGLTDGREILTRRGRLTPAGILHEAGGDRDKVADLIEANGYGTPTVPSSTYRDDKPAPAPDGVRAEQQDRVTALMDDTAALMGRGTGSGQPPRPPAPPAAAGPDPSDPSNADLPAWQARQDAITTEHGLDFKGDVLKPWEVRSVERLVRRGEKLDWIADDRTTSTADFDWLNRNVAGVEMKTTKARISTIRGRILDAASRAMLNHGVKKDTFLIDIGHEHLTDQLRRELETYNFDQHGNRRQNYRLSRLFVMSENGAELDEIDLRN